MELEKRAGKRQGRIAAVLAGCLQWRTSNGKQATQVPPSHGESLGLNWWPHEANLCRRYGISQFAVSQEGQLASVKCQNLSVLSRPH